MTKEKPDLLHQEVTSSDFEKELVLYNDEINTFDYVIEALVEICELEPLQAEQITLIVHYKGKSGVKSGSLTELKPPYIALIDRGLTVSIE
ncbi:MAG: ATP-dependent Clp protease adaptor ClpS [Lentimicrobium sp.]|nr:ATP-dependent Clp protease adaptor ClpS [Lentimicrobium sp.]MDD2527858.1 ATP-dependent Clp protease adaptor ClpS [Lentimicrobiaceae bacterium]MDD4596946.1 ATP-dependent Clp protease adaptor ClpS [Lentimicrobiaceae bacterium]MDY0024372.1 ATP-dependent Clp protease adaptor ClpS [Lentimicrobium sp.]HAH59795.1 Clp protease ClpS [Bacteroidales bacterium]